MSRMKDVTKGVSTCLEGADDGLPDGCPEGPAVGCVDGSLVG